MIELLYSFQVRMICYCIMQHGGKPTRSYEHIICFIEAYYQDTKV